MSNNIAYQVVTDFIIASLDDSNVDAKEWKAPWNKTGFNMDAMNVNTGNKYNGVNVFILGISAMRFGYPENKWGSYKQLAEKGLQVRKGEKGTPIIFFKMLEKKNDAGKVESKFPLARYSTVFNVAQCEGYVAPAVTAGEHFADIDAVEAFIAATGANIQIGGDAACYIPSMDMIRMPAKESFVSDEHATNVEHFYSTMFHELVHWTKHKSRLDRSNDELNTDRYAFEELVAELGAAMINHSFGLPSDGRADHAQYIKGWLKALKSDPKYIVQAAKKAQAAADFLLKKEQVQQEAA